MCHIYSSEQLERDFDLRRPRTIGGLRQQSALFALGHRKCNNHQKGKGKHTQHLYRYKRHIMQAEISQEQVRTSLGISRDLT